MFSPLQNVGKFIAYSLLKKFKNVEINEEFVFNIDQT